MFFSKLAQWTSLCLVGSAFAAPPHPMPDQLSNHPEDEGAGHLSLPSLFELKDITQLKSTWKATGGTTLDTGRVVFKETGSLWSIAKLENTNTEWTIEYVFRSTGNQNANNKFVKNGLAFWLTAGESGDAKNSGEPSTFDGFQFLVSSGDVSGLKIFGGDGKPLQLDLDNLIGNCAFNYLDSQVPTTVRLSYLRGSNWFKVQVDNNLCFKTDKIAIPLGSDDFKFGVSANIEPGSSEVFELFKLKVWDHLTADAVDDHGLLSDGKVKIAFATVTEGSAPTSYVKPGVIRESLMAKNQRQREEIIRNMQKDQEAADLNEKHSQQPQSIDIPGFESLKQQVQKIDNAVEKLDNAALLTDVAQLVQVQVEQQQTLIELKKSMVDFEVTITSQYSQLLNAVAKLNEKVIGEVREQQYGVESVAKKVDLLMNNHKEIQYKYEQQSKDYGNRGVDIANLLSSLTKWVLIPIVIGIILLTFIVYRLRHDIKHSKLL